MKTQVPNAKRQISISVDAIDFNTISEIARESGLTRSALARQGLRRVVQEWLKDGSIKNFPAASC